MTLRTDVMRRNPQTGKLEKTGKSQVYGYVPREGGGYSRGVAAVVDNKTGYVVPTEGAVVGKKLSDSQPVVKPSPSSPSSQPADSQAVDSQETPQGISEQQAVSQTPENYVYLQQTSASEIARRAVQASQPSQESRIQPAPPESRSQWLERNIEQAKEKSFSNENKNGILAATYATEAFVLGGVKGTIQLVKTAGNWLFNPVPTAIKTVQNIPEAVSNLPTVGESLKSPSAAGEIVIPAVVIYGVGSLASKAASKFLAVESGTVGEARASTVSFDLKDGVTGEVSETSAAFQVNRKIRGTGVSLKPREFKVDSVSKAKTVPDAEGTTIRSEITESRISEVKVGELLNNKAEPTSVFRSVSRSDVQGKAGSSSGTFTQLTEAKNGVLSQSGKVASKTVQVSPETSVSATAVESSVPQKVSSVLDAENIKYPSQMPQGDKLTAVASKTNKLVELEAPLNVKIFEENGVKASAQTAPVRQTLSETGSVSFTGRNVETDFQTGRDISVSRTPEGKFVVDINRKSFSPSSESRSLSTQVVQTEVVGSSGSPNIAFVSSKQAVEAIVRAEQKASFDTVVKTVSSGVPVVSVRGGKEGLSPFTIEKQKTTPVSIIVSPPVNEEKVSAAPLITIEKPKTVSAPRYFSRPQRKPKSEEQTAVVPVIKKDSSFVPDTVRKQFQEQEQKQETATMLKPIFYPAQAFDTAIIKPPVVFPVVIRPKGDDSSPGFGVFVRRKGVFYPVGGNYSEKDALAFGRNKVGTTLAASFKIRPVNEKPSEDFSGREIRSQDFYKSTREANVYVQKRSARLSNPGEKAEIKKSKRFKL